MLKLNSVKRDLAREAEGEWIDIAEWPGVRLKVRSINNKDYTNARDAKMTALSRSLGRVPFEAEMAPHIAKLAASFLLLGWEGLIVGDGETPTEYGASIALEVLTDPAMSPLVAQVIWAAGRVGTREAEFVGDATKNSARPSATS